MASGFQLQSCAYADRIDRQVFIVFCIWTLIIVASFWWNVRQTGQQVLALAATEAKANLSRDLAFRRWATDYGGIYVRVDAKTRPNPYLANIPERNVPTPDGGMLTRYNPATAVAVPLQPYLQTQMASQRDIGLTHGGIWLIGVGVIAFTARRTRRHAAEAERQLRKISQAVEQGAHGVLITDATGIVEYVNPKLPEINGYTPAELRGLTPRVLKSGETDPATYRDMWLALKAGKAWHGELKNHRKDGAIYGCMESISPVEDEAGKGNFQYYDEAINALTVERLDLEHGLRKTIARAVIALAQNLRLASIAEGVETEEQLLTLKALGCDAIQGYHVGRPIPPADLLQLIARNRQRSAALAVAAGWIV